MRVLGANNERRIRQAFMSNEDNAAFSAILRQKISPLQILDVDFAERTVRILDSLVDKSAYNIFVTSPEPGDRTVAQLEQVLQHLEHESNFEEFRMKLPRRQFLYHPLRGFRKSWTRPEEEGGVEVEASIEAMFHFVYNKHDALAHAFAEKILRLLTKFQVHHFAVVNAETGELRKEVRKGSAFWAGPHVVESCRQAPRRFLMVWYRGGDNGESYGLAPLPLESGFAGT